MTTRRPPRPRNVLAAPLALALAGLAVVAGRAEAQLGAVAPSGTVFGQSGLNQPMFPPSGGWARVLTATDKWLVLVNEQGQQFPVAYDSTNTGNFFMRWPISPLAITPADLVEVTGLNLGTNRVAADHVDVYRGASRALVQPTYQNIIGYNRVVTPFDIERQNTFGINWQYLLTPGEEFMPARLHVVGSPVNAAPVQIAVGGNNGVTVVNGNGVPTMTEVTRGTPGFVQPGDMAYVVPVPQRATSRSLAIAQLVIFKNVPVDAFGR
jgi:hypothetical protein